MILKFDWHSVYIVISNGHIKITFSHNNYLKSNSICLSFAFEFSLFLRIKNMFVQNTNFLKFMDIAEEGSQHTNQNMELIERDLGIRLLPDSSPSTIVIMVIYFRFKITLKFKG